MNDGRGIIWGAICKAVCALWTFLRKWGIVGDIRSAVVGALVGSAFTFLAAAWAAGAPKDAWIFPNDAGYAQPMRSLVDSLKREDSSVNIRFEPGGLENIYICEYAHLSGFSYREILFSYLDRYSTCFWVAQRSASEYIIRPNNTSGFLNTRNGGWFCKCGP